MTKIEVTCGKCGHKFYKDDYESKSCPYFGHVATKSKSRPSGPCFITTACVGATGFPNNCTELESLRYLRDEHLAKSDEGKKEIFLNKKRQHLKVVMSFVKEVYKHGNI